MFVNGGVLRMLYLIGNYCNVIIGRISGFERMCWSFGVIKKIMGNMEVLNGIFRE